MAWWLFLAVVVGGAVFIVDAVLVVMFVVVFVVVVLVVPVVLVVVLVVVLLSPLVVHECGCRKLLWLLWLLLSLYMWLWL